MVIGLKIKELLSTEKRTKKDLAKFISKARNTLDQYIEGQTSPSVETLIQIAKFFRKPVSVFFEDEIYQGSVLNDPLPYGQGVDPEKNANFINLLKSQLREKEEEIKFLRRIINEKL